MNRLWILVGLTAGALIAQTPFATGLQSPIKITRTPTGSFIVSEAGAKPNTGRLSLLDKSGVRRDILSGLPSAITEGSSVGPTATLLRGRTIFALIGEGDVLVQGTVPGTEVYNPAGSSSPIFSSLLSITLSVDLDLLTKGFTMTMADQYKLADGMDLSLDNGAGASAIVSLIADFRDVTPDPNTILRGSDPFGMDFDAKNPQAVYIADSGQNSIIHLDLVTGRAQTLTHFAPFPTNTPGPPVADAVPTSVHSYADHLLITFLSGFPFASYVGRVVEYDPAANTSRVFIANLTTAMDIAWRDRPTRTQFYTLEFSLGLLGTPPAPGRLVRYDTIAPTLVTAALVTPSSMAMDPNTGDVYVTEVATGRVIRFPGQ